MQFDERLRDACLRYLKKNVEGGDRIPYPKPIPGVQYRGEVKFGIDFSTDEYQCAEGTCDFTDSTIHVWASWREVEPPYMTWDDVKRREVSYNFRGYDDREALATFMSQIDPYLK